jgi:hypothetical protein
MARAVKTPTRGAPAPEAPAPRAGALKAELARSNPFRLTGTALPPNVLLAGKMIVLCLALLGYPEKLPEIHLPMIRAFDLVPDRAAFRTAMIVAFYAGAVGLLLNRWVRASAFLAGFVFLLEPLVARAHVWYGNFFCAAMLILMGLHREPIGLYLLRWQMVVMYAGSALNKALQTDWYTRPQVRQRLSGPCIHAGGVALEAPPEERPGADGPPAWPPRRAGPLALVSKVGCHGPGVIGQAW